MTKALNSDPKGRVDLLIFNLAKRATQILEVRMSAVMAIPKPDLWSHLEPIVKSEIRRRRIPARSLTPIEIVGLVSGKRPRRLKCTG
jgi:hypothetical protein